MKWIFKKAKMHCVSVNLIRVASVNAMTVKRQKRTRFSIFQLPVHCPGHTQIPARLFFLTYFWHVCVKPSESFSISNPGKQYSTKTALGGNPRFVWSLGLVKRKKGGGVRMIKESCLVCWLQTAISLNTNSLQKSEWSTFSKPGLKWLYMTTNSLAKLWKQ